MEKTRCASGTRRLLTGLSRASVVPVLAGMLAACGHRPSESAASLCSVLPRAEFEIIGADPYSQAWADDTVEAGIGACGFPRPKPRDAEAPVIAPPPRPEEAVS